MAKLTLRAAKRTIIVEKKVPKPEDERKPVTLRIPEKDWAELKLWCVKNNKPLDGTVALLVSKFLESRKDQE